MEAISLTIPAILWMIGAGVALALIGYWLWSRRHLKGATRGRWNIGFERDRDEFHEFAGPTALIFGSVMLVALAASAVPYNPHYWRHYEVSGHVESVSNTFLEGDGDVTTSTYVVSLDTLDFDVQVTDARVVNLDDADVTLRCTPSWVYLAADKWNCSLIGGAR